MDRQPNRPDFRAHFSEALRAAGDHSAALKHASWAVKLAPQHAPFHNTLALASLAQGEFERAAAALDEAVRLKPTFALALNNQGVCRRELKRHAEALDSFFLAVRMDPALATARANLGQQLLEEHRAVEALEHCQHAVRLAPNMAAAHNNLGNVLRRLGRIREAHDCYQRALRLAPNDALIHGNLGQVHEDEGRLDEALRQYQLALRFAPRNGLLHTYLAGLLRLKRSDEAALAVCRQALEFDPTEPAAHCLLGELLAEQGDDEGAEAAFLTAIRLRPKYAPAQVGLGRVFSECGAEDQAIEGYRAAVRSDPRQVAALAALATHLRGRFPDTELAAARRLLDESLSERDRATLEFGMAHALDGRGRFTEAAALFRSANALWKQQLDRMGHGYDPTQHRRFVDLLSEQFSPSSLQRWNHRRSESDLPIFVVGLPRSGTTLIEQILASHPDVFGAGELTWMAEVYDALKSWLRDWDAPSARGEREAAFHRCSARLVAGWRQLHPTALRVVDKMPDNLHYVGLIATLFPNARIVICRRDVRDVALSCWTTHFRRLTWAFDQDHITARIQDARRLIDYWRQLLPRNVLEIDYEDTVDNVEAAARRLTDWCGLPWRSECLRFHQHKRPVRTASVTQVRQPIHGRSVGRWRHYAGELEGLFASLAPLFGHS